MILKLMWKDKDGDKYHLGTLIKTKEQYIFKIEEENLKNAIKKGCMGIGEFDLLSETYASEKLFKFFKERIPDEKHPKINEILKKYNMINYDEMILLQKTKAELMTDRYFVE